MVRKYTKKKTKSKRKYRKSTSRKKKASTRTRRPRVKPSGSYDTEARKSLAIYTNPFSAVNGNSKIPDGKAIHSVGCRVRVSAQLHNSTVSIFPPDTLHILMYPGLTQGMVVWGDDSDYGTRGFTAYAYNDHSTFDFTNIWNNGNIAPGIAENNDNINRWRVVSQGLKLSLLNTDEENDGFWEAIRYTDGMKANEFGFYSGDNLGQVQKCVFGPDHSMYSRLASKSLANSPTYCTGALKNIDKTVFELQPQTEDHDFRVVNRQYAFDLDDLASISGNNDYITMQNDTPQNQLVHQALIDDAYDCLYIRIHCRPNNDQTNSNGSRILAHLISNQEVCYDEDQNEAKFMTRTDPADDLFENANKKRRKFSVAGTGSLSTL